jgi:group I intron endonuclease
LVGIYCITNIINNKKYIGQSVDIHKRVMEHKRDLAKNIHPNSLLQNSWNKYGKENFLFEVIEECEKENLTIRELYWVNKLNLLNKEFGFNIAIPDKSVMLGRHHTEKTKALLSKIRKISTIGKGNGFYGKHHSDETKLKISIKGKGKQMGIKNPMFGKVSPFKDKKHSKDTRKIMSINHANFTGQNHPKAKLSEQDVKNIIIMILKEIKIKDIAIIYNVKKSCIDAIKAHKNWTYLTKDIIFPKYNNRPAETTILQS